MRRSEVSEKVIDLDGHGHGRLIHSIPILVPTLISIIWKSSTKANKVSVSTLKCTTQHNTYEYGYQYQYQNRTVRVQVHGSNQTGVPKKPVITQYVTWYMHAYNLQGGGGMGDNLINEFMMHIFTIASFSCCTVILVSFPLIPVHNIYCLLLQPVHFLRASMNGMQSNYDIHHTIFDIEQYVSFHICTLKKHASIYCAQI